MNDSVTLGRHAFEKSTDLAGPDHPLNLMRWTTKRTKDVELYKFILLT